MHPTGQLKTRTFAYQLILVLGVVHTLKFQVKLQTYFFLQNRRRQKISIAQNFTIQLKPSVCCFKLYQHRVISIGTLVSYRKKEKQITRSQPVERVWLLTSVKASLYLFLRQINVSARLNPFNSLFLPPSKINI